LCHTAALLAGRVPPERESLTHLVATARALVGSRLAATGLRHVTQRHVSPNRIWFVRVALRPTFKNRGFPLSFALVSDYNEMAEYYFT
jgi:hypothetical protein